MDDNSLINLLIDFDRLAGTNFFRSTIEALRKKHALITLRSGSVDIDYLKNFPEEELESLICSSGFSIESITATVSSMKSSLRKRHGKFRLAFTLAESCFRGLGFRFQLIQYFDDEIFETYHPFCCEPEQCLLLSIESFCKATENFESACRHFLELRFEPKDLSDRTQPDPLKHAFCHLLWQCERGPTYAIHRETIVSAYADLQGAKNGIITTSYLLPETHDYCDGRTQGVAPGQEGIFLSKLLENGYSIENVTDKRSEVLVPVKVAEE